MGHAGGVVSATADACTRPAFRAICGRICTRSEPLGPFHDAPEDGTHLPQPETRRRCAGRKMDVVERTRRGEVWEGVRTGERASEVTTDSMRGSPVQAVDDDLALRVDEKDCRQHPPRLPRALRPTEFSKNDRPEGHPSPTNVERATKSGARPVGRMRAPRRQQVLQQRRMQAKRKSQDAHRAGGSGDARRGRAGCAPREPPVAVVRGLPPFKSFATLPRSLLLSPPRRPLRTRRRQRAPGRSCR